MSTYTDIRYDYNLPSGFGGGLTLLQTNTITSGVASSSFTSGIDSTYRTYMFKFISMHPANDGAQFEFNFSTDGGSNYNVTKTSTAFESAHNEAGTVTNLAYATGADLAQSTSYQHLAQPIGADNDQAVSGSLFLFSPSSTTFVKHFIAVTNNAHKLDYTVNHYMAGYGNTTSAVDAIDFKMDTGNIDNGTIKMYGIA
jgi:hypothetical protein